jgi:hypothetical protein
MRVPADVCGIDPDQAIHQAQREPADAALGKVGLEHRRAECHIATAGGDRGAEFEPDRLEDLLMEPGREMTFEQVERYDVDLLWLLLEYGEHIGREAGRRIPLAHYPFADVASGVEKVGVVGQLPPRSGCRDPDDVTETTNGGEQCVR